MEKPDFNKMDAFGLIDYLSSMENDALMRELTLEDALTRRRKVHSIPNEVFNILMNTAKSISNGKIEVALWNILQEYNPL